MLYTTRLNEVIMNIFSLQDTSRLANGFPNFSAVRLLHSLMDSTPISILWSPLEIIIYQVYNYI
jgi:hypothetical protein